MLMPHLDLLRLGSMGHDTVSARKTTATGQVRRIGAAAAAARRTKVPPHAVAEPLPVVLGLEPRIQAAAMGAAWMLGSVGGRTN